MSRRRWLWLASFGIIVLWYPVLTYWLGFSPFKRTFYGQVFNDMARHLLLGHFDIGPNVIGSEAFEVNGQTVSYFGIFCAVLRIPLVLWPGHEHGDEGWWSGMIAVWIGVWFQLRAIGLLWTETSPPRQAWLAAALWISVLLGGEHIQFLRPTVYQEIVNWAFSQAACFVFLATRGLTTPRGFDRPTLCWMAVCAGLALLTRVSFGLGLYAAFGLLLLANGKPRRWPVPVCIALFFVVMVGIVNEGRWGNPLTFADFSRYDISQDVYPDRLGHLAAYGDFNIARIWLGLCYYFLPIWIWVRSDGHVMFAEAQATMMDSMELPPGSFFLTDPFLLGLALAGVLAIRDRVRAALVLGLAIPAVLMLCAISMAHRYRMEFYPALFLAALFGVAAAGRRDTTRLFRYAIISTVTLGIVASHAMAVLSAWSQWGPGDWYIERYGLVGTYTRPDVATH